MGGQITVAFRFSNGEACCFDRWTNNLDALQKIEILDGDESVARDYIAMTRNNDYTVDPSYNGLPISLKSSQYGFLVIDFMTKTIVEINGYSSMFSGIDAGLISDRPRFAKYRDILLSAVNSGRKISRTTVGKDRPVVEILGGQAALDSIEKDKGTEEFVLYDIDVSPWRYVSEINDPKYVKAGLKIIREIGFPMTRKEGLNVNFPFPKINRKALKTELKARYLWMRMKSMPEYKEFDGVPWERLAKSTQAEILDVAQAITDAQYDAMHLNDFIGATTTKAMISING